MTIAEKAILRSEEHNEIVYLDYDAAAHAELMAECDDHIDANDCTEFWADDPDSDDGMTWRVHMRHPTPQPAPKETKMTNENGTVLLETMPDYLRGSHRAARNFGAYPHNGAVREWIDADEAEEIIAADPDGYAHVVEVV